MSADIWIALIVVFLSLALSAFFAGAETAITASSRARMHALEQNGDKNAAIVNKLMLHRDRFIGAMLLGNQLVNIAAAAYTTNVLVGLVGDTGVFYATGIMTALVVIFAEVMPKTIAINSPDRISLILARAVALAVMLFGPVVVTVEALVKLVLKIFGVHEGDDDSMLSGHEELKGAVDLLHREGGVERADRDMVGGLLDLKDLQVSDVMIHRTKMRTISINQPAEDLVREVLASPYTRLPLWKDNPDNIVGVIHAKDLLRAFDAAKGDTKKLDISDIALDPWFVPDTTTLQDQLQAFLKRKTHFALVVDEYGEVMGLVTLEDILEEIVGDIKDEHDLAVQGVRVQADGSVNVDGAVPIRDLNRVMDWELPDEEATTMAGLVIHAARAIPEVGQVFLFYGFRFQVMRKNKNKITLIRIAKVTAEVKGESKSGGAG